ncbi:MAG: Nmad5 family putative nucleotide modification protein [Undibacterium sp.]
MKTTNIKLTKAIRATISNLLTARKFTDRQSAINDARAALALDFYNDSFSEKDRELMNSLPEGWLPLYAFIKGKIGAGYEALQFSGELDFSRYYNSNKGVDVGRSPVRYRFPAASGSEFEKVYEATHPFAERFARIEEDQTALKYELASTRGVIAAALSKASGTDKLIAGWPEIESIVALLPQPQIPSSNLPAISMKDLNELLDLPVEKAT